MNDNASPYGKTAAAIVWYVKVTVAAPHGRSSVFSVVKFFFYFSN
jgi:hypothetical protein